MNDDDDFFLLARSFVRSFVHSHLSFSFVYQSWANTRLLLKFSLRQRSRFNRWSDAFVPSSSFFLRVARQWQGVEEEKNNNASGWEKIKVRVAKLELATDSKTKKKGDEEKTSRPPDLDINRTANLT